MSIAYLVLSDGTVFQGQGFGRDGVAVGEVVFNTGMTGYQEIMTDPSYAGQLVTPTYPLIGNYGVTPNDFESRRVQASGLIIKELCNTPSNWRSDDTLDGFLAKAGVIGISGIDTRSLTRKIRASGVMMGGISTTLSPEQILAEVRAVRYETGNYVEQVTTDAPYVWRTPASATTPDGEAGDQAGSQTAAEPKYRVALLDCGVKFNILRSLTALGAEVTVWPASTTAEMILGTRPDGVFLSPGPGDPALLGSIVENVRVLMQRKPTMGICLGNQLIGCAGGGKTFKLPFGHRGSNHPVKDLVSGRVVITSQNHGYALGETFADKDLEVCQINLNDGTVEGLRHKSLPVFSIQYHPEASPGPTDSNGYFAEFLKLIDASR